MKRIILRSLTALTALALLLTSNYVLAQDTKQGGSGIQISPTRTELTLDKGQAGNVNINIKNITPGPIVAKAYLHDFESDNETGEPILIVDPKRESAYSLKHFVSKLTDVELQPGETKTVTLTVNIPSSAVPGGYFGAVRFAAVPKGVASESEGPQVGLTASVAHLVLVSVPGNVQIGMKLARVGVERDNSGGSFFIQAPNKGIVSVTNTGNGFIKPFGKVTITKGSKEVYSYELNNKNPRSNVLPKSSRIFKDNIKNIDSFGRYTITASISHSNGGEVLVLSKNFWVIPSWLLALVGLLVVALAAIIYLYNKQTHRYRLKVRRKK